MIGVTEATTTGVAKGAETEEGAKDESPVAPQAHSAPTPPSSNLGEKYLLQFTSP
ncbi:hypothetical protein L195_g063619, partial [Trifolium pratense]